jgi:hypothetical protein
MEDVRSVYRSQTLSLSRPFIDNLALFGRMRLIVEEVLALPGRILGLLFMLFALSGRMRANIDIMTDTPFAVYETEGRIRDF